MKLNLFLVMTVLSFNAFGKGIVCSKDSRPVDGTYEEVRIEEGREGFDVTHKSISPHDPDGKNATVTTLAKGLKCNFDGLIAFCFKSSRDNGESQNSIATVKQVEVTQLSSLEQAKAKKEDGKLQIDVSSPLTKRKHYEFEPKHHFGGCKTL